MSTNIPVSFTSLLSVSELVTGLVLIGKQTPTGFDPDKMHSSYSNIMRDIKSGKDLADLQLKYSNLIQTSMYAARSVNGLGEELDWVDVLERVYRSETVSSDLDRVKKLLDRGEIDKAADTLRRAESTLSSSQRLRSVPADEISDEYEPFIRSGSIAWDEHIGGFPTTGIIILAAKTYVGKTSVAISAMDGFLHQWPDKEILFVTLEDQCEGWKHRAKQILGDRNKEFWHRIKVMEFAENPTTIIQEASRYPKVGLIILDYLDYLVDDDLSAYKNAYKVLGIGAKSLAVANEFKSMPIIILAQFGKGAYQGGVPTQHCLMYTGDQFSYQICMLYQPNGDNYADNPNNTYTLPTVPGKGYLVFWKVKNGCHPHLREFPGAIQVNYPNSNLGFDLNDDQSKWFSLGKETQRPVSRSK